MIQSGPQSEQPVSKQGGNPESMTNGPAAAAILSAGAGCTILGILDVAGDVSKPLAKLLTFYLPTGPLSGVTTLAIVFWLVMWFDLARRWRNKTVALAKINATAFLLLALGILLTFPPFADFITGK